jgi:hypothetical protein
VALRLAAKAVRILCMVQRAAGQVINNIGLTTGYPPRREDYTDAQGRRVERQQRRKSLGWPIVRRHARSFVPSDEGTQAEDSGVETALSCHCEHRRARLLSRESCSALPDDFLSCYSCRKACRRKLDTLRIVRETIGA